MKFRTLSAIASIICTFATAPAAASPDTSTAVRINVESGLGSGVYIGNGEVVTALHVVDGSKAIRVTDQKGDSVSAHVARTLPSLDIAVLTIDDLLPLAKSPLRCAPSPVGDTFVGVGNPLGFDFVDVWGRIASGEQPVGDWSIAQLADAQIIPGDSGGPIYDSDGDVAGIMVGAVGVGGPMGGLQGATLGIIVPSDAICATLAPAVA